MVRAPCCDKIGLKRGPWTPEEDNILVSHIQTFGHGNWRALPKQAGLLRCGKSCRLRWTNYLRPDIKRGNFTREEEDMIISLHEMLGNRWSAIAARLPGRTDNEIKNVWHTHLKKRLPKQNHSAQESKRKARLAEDSISIIGSKPITLQPISIEFEPDHMIMQTNSMSPDWRWSHRDVDSCSVSNSSSYVVMENKYLSNATKIEIDESFWTEALPMENCKDLQVETGNISENLMSSNRSSNDDDGDIDFWLRVFMEAGELQLPEL